MPLLELGQDVEPIGVVKELLALIRQGKTLGDSAGLLGSSTVNSRFVMREHSPDLYRQAYYGATTLL